jgi:hypothetical protein
MVMSPTERSLKLTAMPLPHAEPCALKARICSLFCSTNSNIASVFSARFI